MVTHVTSRTRRYGTARHFCVRVSMVVVVNHLYVGRRSGERHSMQSPGGARARAGAPPPAGAQPGPGPQAPQATAPIPSGTTKK